MVAESYFWSAAGQEKGTGYFTGVKCLCEEPLSERDRKGDRPFGEEGLSQVVDPCSRLTGLLEKGSLKLFSPRNTQGKKWDWVSLTHIAYSRRI